MKKTICVGLTAVFLMLSPADSAAKFSLIPSLQVSEEYNDNIFLDDTNEEEDYITRVSPNIILEYAPNQALDLSLDYGLDYRFYSRNSSLNDTSLSETQRADFKADAHPFNRVYVNVTDVYERVPVDVRRKTAEANVIRNKTDSNRFSASPYVQLPLTSTVSTRFGYTYGNIWYRDDDAINYESHSVFLNLEKQFTTRLRGSLTYTFYMYRPDKTDADTVEYDRQQGSLEIVYQLTTDIELTGEVGQAWFDFDQTRDTDTSFWNIGIDYTKRLAETTTLGVSYGTAFIDSTVSGAAKNYRADMIFNSGEAQRLTVNAYHSIDKFINADREDRITGVSADFRRPLTRRLTVLLGGGFERQKFLPESEVVKMSTYTGEFEYKLTPDMTAEMGYRYSERDSNLGADEYGNNILWLTARVIF